jgi:N4-gp56 family major capsid protein
MAATEFALNDALAVQRWSTSLAVEAEKKQYFTKFMGTGEDAMIKIQKELTKQAGESITVAMRMKLTGDGVEGDDPIEGTSAVKAMTFYNDKVIINQRRTAAASKGAMSEQRVPYDMRKEARDAIATWWAEDYDEQTIMYLSGARGVDTSFHTPVGYTGRAGNSFNAPDTSHIVYAGAATAKTDLDSADVVDLTLIDRLVAKIETMDPQIMPFMIDGERRYVFLMHIYAAFDLRKSVSDGDWADIQKRQGAGSLLFKNALGEHNGIILHKHRNVIRYSDYGAGADVTACRNLLLGAQAGLIAWGGNGTGVGRYKWVEKLQDADNRLEVYAGAIFGVKGAYFNSQWLGRIAVDSYCDDPNS